MAINVSYEPIAAIGAGSYGAGYGQYAQRIAAQQQEERMLQQRLAAEAARQQAEIIANQQAQAAQIQAQKERDFFNAKAQALRDRFMAGQDLLEKESALKDALALQEARYGLEDKQIQKRFDLGQEELSQQEQRRIAQAQKERFALDEAFRNQDIDEDTYRKGIEIHAAKSAGLPWQAVFEKPGRQTIRYDEDRGIAEVIDEKGNVLDFKPYERPGVVYGSEVDPETHAVWGLDRKGQRIKQLAPGAKQQQSYQPELLTKLTKDAYDILKTKQDDEEVPPSEDQVRTWVKNQLKFMDDLNASRRQLSSLPPPETYKLPEPAAWPAPVQQAAFKAMDEARERGVTGPEDLDKIGFAAANAAMPTVGSIQEAMSLPPGTVFRTPDGRVKVR